MKLIARDYELPKPLVVDDLKSCYCPECDQAIGKDIEGHGVVLEPMSAQDFERWSEDLLNCCKAGDYTHAEILLNELKAIIT